MRRLTCDGCLCDIETGDRWFGMDEFMPWDDEDEDDEVSPVDDAEFQFHFHAHRDARCVWAWSMARQADQPITEEEPP